MSTIWTARRQLEKRSIQEERHRENNMHCNRLKQTIIDQRQWPEEEQHSKSEATRLIVYKQIYRP